MKITMKKSEEIMKAVVQFETAPADFNLIESECFLVLKRLYLMFRNEEITRDASTKMKQKILKSYEEEVIKYDFMISMYKEHIENIKKTENDRIKLHKLLNKTEPVDEARLTECLKSALNIIACVFPGEFNQEV